MKTMAISLQHGAKLDPGSVDPTSATRFKIFVRVLSQNGNIIEPMLQRARQAAPT